MNKKHIDEILRIQKDNGGWIHVRSIIEITGFSYRTFIDLYLSKDFPKRINVRFG